MGKHQEVKRWELYDEEGNLQGESCPRCNSLIADHGNRKTCGSCGYSEMKK